MFTTGMRRVFLCCFLILALGVLRAADSDELPPPPVPPGQVPFIPVLQVRGAEDPVRLKTLAIQITIQGGFAEVGLDMLFHNPNRRDLEGELHFPLFPGQEISGLALDIQGELRAGVPVSKTRGQEIFDDIVRRSVDPALLESTQGNAYKLRVYPIPGKGTRRVVVRVLQPLSLSGGMYSLRLPLAFARHLDALTVEALVAASEPPKVDSGGLGLVLEQAGLLYRGKVEKTDLTPEGWLTISVPAPTTPDKGANAVRWNDKVYFTAAAVVDGQTRKRELPKLATIVWDASGSGADRDHAREYALLDRYFAALGDGTARLVVVRNVAEPAKEFSVRGGDWRELKASLHALPYDGGTDLASWKPTDDCAEYLLFTDGLANFGASLTGPPLPAIGPERRLYCVTASTQADHNLLRHVSGGRLVDLTSLDDAAAARALLEDATRVAIPDEELAGKGRAILEPVLVHPDPDTNRLHLRLAGWIKAGTGTETVTLAVEHPDGKRESIPVAIPLDKAEAAAGDAPLPARLWARYAIMELEAEAEKNQAAIIRLGQEFGVVSRGTSLIVLETAADYARYDVPPPADLKDEVARLRRDRPARTDAAGYLPMETLERLWAEKVAWWEKDFSKPVKDDKARKPEPVPAAAGDVEMDYMAGAGSEAFAVGAAPAQRGIPGRTLQSPHPAAVRESAPESAPESAAGPDAARGGAKDIGIALQVWKSDAPYIERMNKAEDKDLYAIYLDERPGYARSSAFYLDMADRFLGRKMPELGLRVLSNLAELELGNRQLLRVLAYRLMEAKEYRLALGVLGKVRELAPYEPQSLRDPAIAHNALGDRKRAADLLYEVARRQWDNRFGDINVIALTELNAVIALAGDELDASAFDRRLIKNLPSDLRVILTWDADNTDMDLWVTDPDGERCDYRNRLTKRGGALSRDCTGGYGPEEFMLRRAKAGVYRVEVEYYGTSQQILTGEVTLSITLTTGFGTPKQQEQVVTMRLKDAKSRVLVGEFTVGGEK